MSEINPLGSSSYYAGLQNTSSQVAKDLKKDKVSSEKKVKFSDILKSKNENNSNFSVNGYPPQIASMSIEDAAVFLRDAVDAAGNKLSENLTNENIAEFRNTVKQFLQFVIENNYIEHKKNKRGVSKPMQLFSKFNNTVRPKDPQLIIATINQKLDGMVRDTLSMQSNNLKILDKANEIKGLIIDLMLA